MTVIDWTKTDKLVNITTRKIIRLIILSP